MAKAIDLNALTKAAGKEKAGAEQTNARGDLPTILPIVHLLREKGFKFPAITQWFKDRNIEVLQSSVRTAYTYWLAGYRFARDESEEE